MTKICSKCGEEKDKTYFYNNTAKVGGLTCHCKECIRKYESSPIRKEKTKKFYTKYYLDHKAIIINRTKTYALYNHEKTKERHMAWSAANPEIVKQYREKHYRNNRETMLKRSRERHRRDIESLSRVYIVQKLKRGNIPITEETIELKRQQIIMMRTLKEFKKWRKANESNYTDVYGKQQPNEENYEGRI